MRRACLLLLVLSAAACSRAHAESTNASPAPAVSNDTTPQPQPVAPPTPIPAPSPAPAANAPPISCPADMVAIPATPKEGFTMGKAYRGETDKPHEVMITHAYCMDATEVTAGDYKKCVEAKACSLPFQGDLFSTYDRHPDYPVNMTNWEQAHAYCEWAGKRLPTEAEWEWAAVGPEGYKYPWGNSPEPDCDIVDYTPLGAPKSNPGGDVGCLGGGPSAVKSHPRGNRHWPSGDLYDMGGNVWEWCEDSYGPYSTERQVDPLVRKETANHVIRGGGWNRPARALMGAFRGAAVFTYQVPGLGFRCAKGEPFTTPPPRRVEKKHADG